VRVETLGRNLRELHYTGQLRGNSLRNPFMQVTWRRYKDVDKAVQEHVGEKKFLSSNLHIQIQRRNLEII
jgi:hypothetical protein